MGLWQIAWRSVLRKPVKSMLLFFIVCAISLLLLSGMASRSASIATKDSTRQAIGAGFLLEMNAENRSKRVEEHCKKIEELYGPGQEGSYDGVRVKSMTVNGNTVSAILTDKSFESLKLEDIEKIAKTEGIADYNVTTVPTPVKPVNFSRIEDPDVDQTNDFKGVALVGDRDMRQNANFLSGNVSIKEGRTAEIGEENVCVISEELAEKNKLQVGERIRFHPIKTEKPTVEAEIIGIYTVKEKMRPYMSGDTYRSENVIFADLHFPEKADNDDPLFVSAYYKVADVDEYDTVKKRIREMDVNWEWYDLIDNNGNLDTMASNFNDLEKISNTMLILVSGASFIILFFIFLFWIKSRTNEMGILMSLGIEKGKIWMQILTEALIISAVAAAVSFFLAPAVSKASADYLIGQSTEQAEIQKKAEEGKVGVDEYFQEAELTVTGVSTKLTGQMFLVDAAGITMLVVLSTSAAGGLIFRKKPKEILSEMS